MASARSRSVNGSNGVTLGSSLGSSEYVLLADILDGWWGVDFDNAGRYLCRRTDHEVPKMMQKKVGAGAAIGIPLAVVLAWIWGILMPDNPMPGPVSAALGSIITTAVAWLVPA